MREVERPVRADDLDLPLTQVQASLWPVRRGTRRAGLHAAREVGPEGRLDGFTNKNTELPGTSERQLIF